MSSWPRRGPVFPRGRAAAAALLLLFSGAGFARAEPFRIVVTERATPLLPNSVIELADTLGYFKREGVDVKLVRVEQTPMAVAAMTSGEGDMADVSVDAAIKLAARGHADFKAVASANTRFPYIIAARDSVRAVTDLPGTRFGIGRVGSLDHALSAEVLRARGIDPTTLRLVSIGQPELRLLALASGRIAATTVSLGTWFTLRSTVGLHVLVSERQFASAAPLVGKVLAVPNKILASRRDDVIAVVTALIKASREFSADPSAWVAAMTRARSDISEAKLTRLAARLRGLWSVNGGLNGRDLAVTADWLYRTPDYAELARVPVETWVDFDIVDTILARVGIDRTGDPPAR